MDEGIGYRTAAQRSMPNVSAVLSLHRVRRKEGEKYRENRQGEVDTMEKRCNAEKGNRAMSTIRTERAADLSMQITHNAPESVFAGPQPNEPLNMKLK
ncbi:hypothetical protein WMY93_031397, partial [Mugilogobius chulae]